MKDFDGWLTPPSCSRLGIRVRHSAWIQPSMAVFSADIHGVRAEALVARVSAERNGRFLGERVVTATLPLPRTEMANVALDAAFLKELATETGGEYRHVSELGEVADAFESVSTVRRVQETHSAWPRWPVFLTLCAVLSALWFARRTVGLV